MSIIMGNLIRHLFILLLFTLFFISIYSPLYNGHYVFGEDYAGLWTNKDWPLLTKESFFSFFHDFTFEGRILGDLYVYIVFFKYINQVKNLDAANTIRLVNTVVLGATAYTMYLIFKINKFKPLHAIMLSILICTLPPSQRYISTICCGFFTFGAFFSSLSALLLFSTIFKNSDNRSVTVISILISAFLLIIALNLYQPSAMIYWALTMVPLVISNGDGFIKRLGKPILMYFLTGFISIVSYYLLVKVMLALIDFTTPSFIRRGGIITIQEIPARIMDFINYPLYTALNLWNIFPNRTVGLSVIMLILIGILSYLIPIKNDKNLSIQFFYRCSLMLILIPMSFSPNVILKEGFNKMIPDFRILLGLEIAVLLFLYSGLFINIPHLLNILFNLPTTLRDRILTIGLTILTIVATLSAYQNTKNFSNLHTGELEYIKKAIKEYRNHSSPEKLKLNIILSNAELLNYHSYFTNLTSMWPGPLKAILHLAIYETGMDPSTAFKVYKNSEGLTSEDKNTITIDMREYQKKAYKELNIPLSVKPFF